MLRLRRPAPGALQGMLAKARAEAPTYAEVGATRHETMPAGYRHDRYEAPLGHGADYFGTASGGIPSVP